MKIYGVVALTLRSDDKARDFGFLPPYSPQTWLRSFRFNPTGKAVHLRTDSTILRGTPRSHVKPAQKASILKGFLIVLFGAMLASTITPSVASAASGPRVNIQRINNQFVVQGHGFAANKTGTVKAGINGLSAQLTVHTNSTGYFWATFYQFDSSHSGGAWTRAWINGVYRDASAHLYPVSSPPKTTTTTAPPRTTTTTIKSGSGGVTGSSGGGGTTSSTGWKLVKSDEFNGNSVNQGMWGLYSGKGNEGIGSRSPSAVSEGNGELRVTGNGMVGGGVALKTSQTYGKYEVRMRFDKGNGYNTAMLLWPTNQDWPVGGEVDLSEIFSGYHGKSGYFDHYGKDNSQFWHYENFDTSAWHVYTVDWERDHITWYLDGKAIWTVTDSIGIPKTSHFLALQLDVAGGSPHNSGTTMHIDYVHVYTKQ